MNADRMKLGRRPPKNAPALRLSSFLTGVVPAAPPLADHFAKVPSWLLGENDRYGDCGPVSVANQRLLITSYLSQPQRVTQDNIFDLYRRSGNPGFDPATGADDNGVEMQTMLEATVAGGIGGTKALAFAKVDPTNEQEWQAAIAIFGSILLGVTLDTAQQAQTDAGLWDYRQSPIWGGHAILGGRYKENLGDVGDRTGVITWAQVVDMTDPFIAHQMDETWVVVWPEHLGTKAFQEGIDLAALASAYEALTGRPFPQVAPPPPPAASPADVTLAASVRAWAFARHSGANRLAAQAVQVWLKAKGF